MRLFRIRWGRAWRWWRDREGAAAQQGVAPDRALREPQVNARALDRLPEDMGQRMIVVRGRVKILRSGSSPPQQMYQPEARPNERHPWNR